MAAGETVDFVGGGGIKFDWYKLARSLTDFDCGFESGDHDSDCAS